MKEKLISLVGKSVKELVKIFKHVGHRRLSNFVQLQVTKIMVTPALARHFLAHQHPQRQIHMARCKEMVADILEQFWSPCLVHMILDDSSTNMRDCLVITGQHVLTAIVEANVAMPMLVIWNVPHDEIAAVEGSGRGQSAHERLYRDAKIKPNPMTPSVGETISALFRKGVRAYGRAAAYRVQYGKKFLIDNIGCLEAVSELFHHGTSFTNRAAVRAAFARAWHKASTSDWHGAAGVYSGKVKSPDSRYVVFEALQTEVKYLQGAANSGSEGIYYYASLYAWAIYLGMLPPAALVSGQCLDDAVAGRVVACGGKRKSGRKWKSRVLPSEDPMLRRILATTGEPLFERCAMTNSYRLPKIDWQNPKYRAWLDAQFSWPTRLTDGKLVK